MNEAEFHRQVTATLLRIEHAAENCGTDIDFENAGDILTLEFANGSKIIINKQGAANQLWVAARSGGFHYNLDPASGRWRNDQNGNELFAELSRLASDQAGTAVDLA
jgi:CyaY protein